MITKLCNKINHLFHPIQGEIWCLHRVVEKRSDYPSNRELEITPDYLERLITKYKSEGFEFASIDQLIRSKSLRPKKQVNISFDDGFRDVYQNAFPLFVKYNIPFTLYLTTDLPEGKADLWWIQMERDRSAGDFEVLMKQIYASGKPMAETMHDLTGTKPDMELCLHLALSWQQIKEMVDSGLCTIGSHSISHPGLTRISLDSCRHELNKSRKIIMDKIDFNAVHFSYPHSMENDIVRKVVSDAGYITAALGYGGSIRLGNDLLRLNRKYIVQP